MIKCVSFLWRCSPRRFLAAIILTIFSGFSAMVLLACATIVLRDRSGHREVVFWSFVGLCLLLPLSRFVAEILISRTVQSTVFGLQMRLSKKIAAAPLRFLEEHGTHQLLSVLIQDIEAFDHALANIPVSCLNLTVVISGLVYLGWLSRVVLVIALGFGVLCIVAYRFPASWAGKALRLAQQAGDGLYQHFSSLMAKELKLHQRRRHAFYSQVLRPSAF
jgi:putative ATP-binding cassette transporter